METSTLYLSELNWRIESLDYALRNLSTREARILRPRLMLHLLRWEFDFSEPKQTLHARISKLVYRLRDELNPSESEVPQHHLARSVFEAVSENIATRIHATEHYLASPRPEGLHLGLRPDKSGGVPLCLMSFAPLDLPHVISNLPFGISPDQTLVLARQVTVGSAPPNTWSFAFARACEWLRARRPEIRMLLTYLDPNLGFTGASYRATNWVKFGTEAKARYVFVDGSPRTNRELLAQYGTAKFHELSELLGDRVDRTRCELKPLLLYSYFLYRSERRKAPRDFLFAFGQKRK